MLAIAARPTPESREASSTTLPVAVASPTCRMRLLPLSASQNEKCTNLRMLNAWTNRFRHIHYSSDFSGDMAENWHLTFVRCTVFATKVSIFGICQTLVTASLHKNQNKYPVSVSWIGTTILTKFEKNHMYFCWKWTLSKKISQMLPTFALSQMLPIFDLNVSEMIPTVTLNLSD